MKNGKLRWQLSEHGTRLVITSISAVDSVIFQKSLSELSKLLALQLSSAMDTDSAKTALPSQLKSECQFTLATFLIGHKFSFALKSLSECLSCFATF